jgi:hypothetical protein
MVCFSLDKETEYRDCVQKFLMKVSGVTAPPQIPIFFVDSTDETGKETVQNMIQFHGWLSSQPALSTTNVQAVALRDKIEDEFEKRRFTGYRYTGPPEDQYRYALYEDRKRQKFTPYNGDPAHFSDWVVENSWEENAGHQKVETLSRIRESEEKRVEHHSGHSFSGFSSRAHTHYSIIRKSWTEQWRKTTDFDGNVTETTPARVGGITEREIDGGRERGHSAGYERMIS